MESVPRGLFLQGDFRSEVIHKSLSELVNQVKKGKVSGAAERISRPEIFRLPDSSENQRPLAAVIHGYHQLTARRSGRLCALGRIVNAEFKLQLVGTLELYKYAGSVNIRGGRHLLRPFLGPFPWPSLISLICIYKFPRPFCVDRMGQWRPAPCCGPASN